MGQQTLQIPLINKNIMVTITEITEEEEEEADLTEEEVEDDLEEEVWISHRFSVTDVIRWVTLQVMSRQTFEFAGNTRN